MDADLALTSPQTAIQNGKSEPARRSGRQVHGLWELWGEGGATSIIQLVGCSPNVWILSPSQLRLRKFSMCVWLVGGVPRIQTHSSTAGRGHPMPAHAADAVPGGASGDDSLGKRV